MAETQTPQKTSSIAGPVFPFPPFAVPSADGVNPVMTEQSAHAGLAAFDMLEAWLTASRQMIDLWRTSVRSMQDRMIAAYRQPFLDACASDQCRDDTGDAKPLSKRAPLTKTAVARAADHAA